MSLAWFFLYILSRNRCMVTTFKYYKERNYEN